MKRRPPPKLLGEQAECALMHQAMQRGFTVSVPFGDSAPYDAIVHAALTANPGRPWRVQVRSVSEMAGGRAYRVHTWHMAGRRAVPITPAEADFIAAWIIPHDAWYIVPVRTFAPRNNIFLYPHRDPPFGMWEHYREAWHLLRRSRLWVPHKPRRHLGPAW